MTYNTVEIKAIMEEDCFFPRKLTKLIGIDDNGNMDISGYTTSVEKIRDDTLRCLANEKLNGYNAEMEYRNAVSEYNIKKDLPRKWIMEFWSNSVNVTTPKKIKHFQEQIKIYNDLIKFLKSDDVIIYSIYSK